MPLQTLDLSFNNLTGPIPPGLGFAVKDTLDLSHNQLTGALNPPSLWGARQVLLNDNLLTSLGSGSIPDATRAAVENFNVHNNQLAGTYVQLQLPDKLVSNLNEAVRAYIHDDGKSVSRVAAADFIHQADHLNNVSTWMSTGDVPPWVFQLFVTSLIDISNNKLTRLPAAVDASRLVLLTYINASSNALTGPIPAALTHITGLETLDLSKNLLTEPVPAGFFGINNLIHLNLGENRLTGALPPQLFSGAVLKALILNKNRITGGVPARAPAVGVGALEYVDLSDNALSGPVPPSLLSDVFSLRKLRLGNNLLSGPVPDFSTACSNLQSLVLENNLLTGPVVPAGLDPAQCGKLLVYDVSGNKLSGAIPVSFAAFAVSS